MKYRPEVDGLRAIAILPVIFFHSGLNLFSGGFLGVDIFFVISGYLITSLLIEDLEKKRYSILSFYERRARRILPALIVVLFFSTLMALNTLSEARLNEYFKVLFSVTTFSSNILLWLMSGYFEPSAEYEYLLHTWSLSVEEQFYIFFPVSLLLLWRFGKTKTALSIFLVAIASFLSSVIWMKDYPDANFYLTFTRTWELLVGALVAFIVNKIGIKNNNVLSFIGLGCILFSIFTFDKSIPTPGFYTIFPILGSALILLYTNDKTILAKIISLKPFIYIGLISYSLYLWHQPVFVYFRFQEFDNKFIEYKGTFAILLIFFISILSYKYVEQPFRKKNTIFTKRIVLLGSSISLISISLLAFYSAKNTEIFFSEEEKNIFASTKRSLSEQCHDVVEFCVKGDTESIDILLLGDSNAYHFSKSLEDIASKKNLNFVSLTYSGCLPLSNFYLEDQGASFNKNCLNFNKSIEQFFTKNNFNGVVFVSAAWLLYLYGEDFYKDEALKLELREVSKVKLSLDGNILNPDERKEEFFKYIERMVALLSAKSNHVFLVGPIPPALINFDSKKRLLKEDNNSPFDTFKKYQSDYDQKLKELSNKYNFLYLRPAQKICKESVCKTKDSGKYLYGDPTHLSDYGQNIIMKPLINDALSSTK